jgi:hypothetical protein
MIGIDAGVATVSNRCQARLRDTVNRPSLPVATLSLQIVPSGLRPMAGVIEAAAMVADALFTLEQFAGTLVRHAAHGAGAGYARRRPTGAEGKSELVGSGPNPA